MIFLQRYCPALTLKHFYFQQIGTWQCNDEHNAEETEESRPLTPTESNDNDNNGINIMPEET